MIKYGGEGENEIEDHVLKCVAGGNASNKGYKFLCNTCRMESELFWQHSECIAKCKEHIRTTGHRDVNVFPCYFMEL